MIRTAGVLLFSWTVVSSDAGAQDPRGPQTRIAVGATVMGAVKLGDVRNFQPAVAAVDTGGHCESPMSHPSGVGYLAYRYKFGTNVTAMRSVVVTVDSLNQIQHYSDGRGDLRAPFSKDVTDANPLGPFTSITLNAVQGFGMVENRRSALPSESIMVKAAAFLDAENLGFPRKMIEFVLNECRKN